MAMNEKRVAIVTGGGTGAGFGTMTGTGVTIGGGERRHTFVANAHDALATTNPTSAAAMPAFLAEAVGKLMVNSNSCTASFTQRAALAALTGSQDCVHAMVAEFHRRRDAFGGRGLGARASSPTIPVCRPRWTV